MDFQQRYPATYLGQLGPMPLPREASNNLQNFLKGEPVILGVSQIMTGLMNICLWIMVEVLLSFQEYKPFIETTGLNIIFLLGPIFLIISGTVSIASGKKTTKKMGLMIMKLVLIILGLIISVLLSAFGCSVVCCDVTSVVVDLSSNERGLAVASFHHEYDDVAFQPA
ncbi:membrane-spanning 4-domains subfamily A member 4A-like isoform X3 [Suricata suricatta]|uniref:membrane-spanning 4-domains subfamily A member 4A-like isoform X3 n=1 Tax=Suricata suricatta TaxID=37032 RepID=UPI00115661B8|nr:membrane-spanning 4-domains subfamily A member 4A-like isoform X3 [Suricata suricatta]